MGRETQLQAFPNDWPLVRQVQSGECSGDLLQTACHYLSWLWRQCYLDRRFEVLRYLLTESAPDDSTRRLYEMAIDGSGPIHPQATATQGHPICWSDADTTKRIHAAISSVEFSSLAAHFGTAKFLAAELYKKSLERREVHALHAYFCELKEYYRAATQANCGTLVLID